MKQALRSILVNSVAIALVAAWLPGIQYGSHLGTLVIAAAVFGIANTFIKPVLSLILLPINVVTLGLAGLFVNTLLLFLVTLVVPQFNVVPFIVPWGTTILALSLIWSYVISSVALSLVAGFLRSVVAD